MTTLTSAVAIGDSQLSISAAFPAGQIPGWVKIDDELLNVGGQDWQTGKTLVLNSPATAAHDSGATVTYAGRPYDANFLAATVGGGGEQTVRLLGPFRVNHDDDEAFFDTGTAVATLQPGTLVIRAFAVVIESFQGANTYALAVGAGDAASGTVRTLTNYVNATANSTSSGVREEGDFSDGTSTQVGIVLESAVDLVALGSSSDWPPATTDGIADFYALIAEPAA